jgi:uncharacterized protein (TIGR03066 family)
VLALSGCSGGKNAKMILGTWEVTKGDLPAGSTLEFTEDGKLWITLKADGQSLTVERTYKLKGDKLTTTGKGPDDEANSTNTIKTLTDKELILEGSKGKPLELKRVEGKKPATNAEKIVGKWESAKGKETVAVTMEFTRDGKVKVVIKVRGMDKPLTVDGTYKVEGDKLINTGKAPDGKAKTEIMTIKKLTDAELIIEAEKGKPLEYKRVK